MTQLLINGSLEDGASSYPVCNPVRPNEVVLSAPAADEAQLERTIAAARAAAASWAALPFDERAGIVIEAAAKAGTRALADDIPQLLVREHGKILAEATFDVATFGGMAGAFAPLAAEALASRQVDSGTLVRHHPLGVVAALLPFNWPVAVMGNKVLPALLTGNVVVVKAPPTCPGAVLAVAAAMGEHLPPGVLSALSGPGPDLGAALVSHPGVDMVSFTGGPSTGQAVMALAAKRTTPVVLELGGNDPAILAPDLTPDADLADKLVAATFITSGQVCMAIKRLYVPRSLMSSVVDLLVERLSKEVIGDGLCDDVTIGPVHQASARDRVERMVAEAADAGANVLRPATIRPQDADAGGYLVSPALVIDPPADSSIVVDEQFAPALPLIPYDDLDEVVGVANATSYGLCASIWSADPERAASIADRLDAGTVFVNTHGMTAMDYRAPFVGWKESGFGAELGPEGMTAFTRPKTVLTAR